MQCTGSMCAEASSCKFQCKSDQNTHLTRRHWCCKTSFRVAGWTCYLKLGEGGSWEDLTKN